MQAQLAVVAVLRRAAGAPGKADIVVKSTHCCCCCTSCRVQVQAAPAVDVAGHVAAVHAAKGSHKLLLMLLLPLVRRPHLQLHQLL
jgi:hypothetical protein